MILGWNGVYWCQQIVSKLVCWWNVVTLTDPPPPPTVTVFKSSKWNLLHMIPVMCRCAWHNVGRVKGSRQSYTPYLKLLYTHKQIYILISCDKVGMAVYSSSQSLSSSIKLVKKHKSYVSLLLYDSSITPFKVFSFYSKQFYCRPFWSILINIAL